MQILIDLLLFAVGLVLLMKGASVFTEYASRTARSLGVSDIVIGLTLVAFTTSLPELAVSMASMHLGSPGIAVGNVIGSNIANIGLVLGISALLSMNIRSGRNEIKQGYIMIAVTIIAVLFIIDGLTPIKGALLIATLLFYVYCLLRDRNLKENAVTKMIEKESLPKGLIFSVIGGIVVVIGANIMISSAINMAHFFNIPEMVIGLTIVAIGTSLPELATSVTAAMKKLEGIALGNIVGSNIFNLLMVLGATSIVGTIPMESSLLIYSIPIMIILTVLLVIFMRVENKLGRLDGIALLSIYILFLYLKFFIIPG